MCVTCLVIQVMNFLDFGGYWDPSLAFVMGCGICVAWMSEDGWVASCCHELRSPYRVQKFVYGSVNRCPLLGVGEKIRRYATQASPHGSVPSDSRLRSVVLRSSSPSNWARRGRTQRWLIEAQRWLTVLIMSTLCQYDVYLCPSLGGGCNISYRFAWIYGRGSGLGMLLVGVCGCRMTRSASFGSEDLVAKVEGRTFVRLQSKQ